jgi:hypothetical protein
MSTPEQALTQVCSAAVIAVMLAICLRSRANVVEVVPGRRSYRIHAGWSVFCGVGGLFVVGVFAFASMTTIPENQKIAAWCSVLSAVLFVFVALVFRAASVTLDETTLTSRTLLSERTVSLRDIESVKVVGLVVEVKFRPDSATNRRPKPLSFLAGFRGLGELLANLRARAGLPAAS